jgi:hypothetical protein
VSNFQHHIKLYSKCRLFTTFFFRIQV